LHKSQIVKDPLVKKYLTLNYYIHYREVKNMTEIERLIPDDILENFKLAVEDFGIDKFIESLGIDKLIEAVGGIKELIKMIGIKKIIENIDPNELKQYLQEMK
jgi:hypothetical protein